MFAAGLPPEFYEFANRAMVREQPQIAILAAASKKTLQARAVVTLIKPEHYTIKRVAEVELFLPLLAMADAC